MPPNFANKCQCILWYLNPTKSDKSPFPGDLGSGAGKQNPNRLFVAAGLLTVDVNRFREVVVGAVNRNYFFPVILIHGV